MIRLVPICGRMTQRPSLVERAFELAGSGRFSRTDDIARALLAEGYLDVRAQLDSAVLRRQLNQLCRTARARAVGA
jgi:hypothetical protein